MKSVQVQLKSASLIQNEMAKLKACSPQLVILFGSHDMFQPQGLAAQVAAEFKNCLVIGSSTAGEITNKGVFDNTLVVTASQFNKSDFRAVRAEIKDMAGTKECGINLVKGLEKNGLKALFLLGRGLDINGSALIEGVREVLGEKVLITGGLAGDGGQFKQTFTMLNGEISDKQVVGFGIYGDSVQVSSGTMGGWEPFGPVRKVTKSKANILYELDGEPALDMYKKYLGDKAKELPAAALLYPFALLKDNQDTTGLIRTILGVNEADKSVILAGDIPLNGLVRLMHTNNEGLVNGARGAAEQASKLLRKHEEGLGILVSCVGRKLVMGSDIDDELDAVREVFGSSMVTGFYSYGEIAPESGFAECKLHNQTMTITYLYEAA